jgi:hypothetical protein
VRAEAGETVRVKTVEAARTRSGIKHEADIFEDLEVLRHGGAGDGKRSGNLVDGHGSVSEPLEDGHAGAIGESVQSGL